MTRVKFCGLTKKEDIEAINRIRPDYGGFVFAKKSRRYTDEDTAAKLKALLSEDIRAVGVFVDEDPQRIADLCRKKVIDMIQLHGSENEEYIAELRRLTKAPVIKAFLVSSEEDIKRAKESSADHILLDAGKGDGLTFDWNLLTGIKRPYFLAGGLDPNNVGAAVNKLHPFAVDVSSGIETDGCKDAGKMRAFMHALGNKI